MDEDESYKLKPQYLLGAVQTLQYVVETIVRQLPEAAMEGIRLETSSYAQRLHKEAEARDRNDLRDLASAAYDVANDLSDAVEAQLADIDSGGAVRTIQPYAGEP